MKILRDIVRGVTDPNVLAAHRNGRCHASEEEIEASLTGHYRDEHIFTLSVIYAMLTNGQDYLEQGVNGSYTL